MIQYWLCILNRGNWDVVQQKLIWGVAKHHRNSIGKVKIGDQLIFYVIGQEINGKRLGSAIVGRAKAASEVFTDTSKIFGSGSVKNVAELFPLRIRLSNLKSSEEEIPFRPLIPELEFIRNKKKWSGHIQGLAMRQIPRDDFEKIVSVII